jgi:uncharacterized protein (TIGR02001 family)
MKKTAILFAALAVCAGVNAQEPRSSYSVTTDFTYASKYIFRGVDRAPDSDSFQGSVEVGVKDFYVGVWTNQPITKNLDNEIDLYAGYKWTLTDNLTAEVVGTYYWYPEAGSGGFKHSTELGAGATYTVNGISTSVYGYYDIDQKVTTWQASVGYSLPLEAIGASLDFSGYYGIADGDDWLDAGVEEQYNYYGVDVSLPYKLSEKATFTLAGHWAQNDQLFDGSIDDDHLWWTASLTVGF